MSSVPNIKGICGFINHIKVMRAVERNSSMRELRLHKLTHTPVHGLYLGMSTVYSVLGVHIASGNTALPSIAMSAVDVWSSIL